MRPRDTATTELERTRHTPVYRERLARGVAVFAAWLARSRRCASDILTTSRLADGHLADFVATKVLWSVFESALILREVRR